MALNRTAELLKTGQQFGRWTVIEDQKYTFTQEVLCRCTCGKQRATNVFNLKSGKSLSCGCINREILATSSAKRRKHQVNPGDKFGRLTVLNSDRYSKVECRCDCGNITTVNAGSLYRNMTKSCGCLHLEMIAAIGRSHQAQGGFSTHTLFGTWQRHARSHHTMHQPWKDSVGEFIRDVEAEIGPRPENAWFVLKNHQLGAVPGNISWGKRSRNREHQARLTTQQRHDIVALVDEGFLRCEVAEEYQISASLVSSICKDPRYAV